MATSKVKADPLKHYDFGSINIATMKSKFVDLMSIANSNTFYTVSLNLNENTAPFGASQFAGYFFKLTSTRCYVVLYRGDTIAQYVGHYNAGTWTWKMTAWQ